MTKEMITYRTSCEMDEPNNDSNNNTEQTAAASLVLLSKVTGLKANKPSHFYVDTQTAGRGTVEILIQPNDGGEPLRPTVRSVTNNETTDNTSLRRCWHVTFLPLHGGTYLITVKFNGFHVNGLLILFI